MFESITEALILKKEPLNEVDYKITVYTKELGKVSGKAKGARKISSKLSAHLEPGNFSKIRLVEKNSLQIVDALRIKQSDFILQDLENLAEILTFEPDLKIWDILSRKFSWAALLKILGWDPKLAVCERCKKPNADYFYLDNQNFLCQSCFLRAGFKNSQSFVKI